MNENSLFWKAFERNPFGAMLALTMPFGMAVALLTAIVNAPLTALPADFLVSGERGGGPALRGEK